MRTRMTEEPGSPFPSGRQQGSATGNPDSRSVDGPSPNSMRSRPGETRERPTGRCRLAQTNDFVVQFANVNGSGCGRV